MGRSVDGGLGCDASEVRQLIPGLPDDLSYQCLLRVPLAYHGHMRNVCKTWRFLLKQNKFYEDRASIKLDEQWICALVRDLRFYNTWRAFDPRANRWLRLPLMPHAPQASAVGQECRVAHGRIFVCGGWRNKPLNDVTTFDPRTNNWSSAAPMLSQRSHFASGTIQEHLYVVGGNDGTQARSQSGECYDPVRNEWCPLPCTGVGLSFCVGLAQDDKLFVKARGGVPRETQVFWPSYNLWTSLETRMLEQPTHLHVVLESQLYRFDVDATSSSSSSSSRCDIKRYDPQRDIWISLAFSGTLFSGSNHKLQDVVVCDGKLWAIADDFSVSVIQVDGPNIKSCTQFEQPKTDGIGKIVSCHVVQA